METIFCIFLPKDRPKTTFRSVDRTSLLRNRTNPFFISDLQVTSFGKLYF